MAVHRWVNKYRVPLPQSDVISEVKPGQQIAKCITEIQEQITEIQKQIDVLAVIPSNANKSKWMVLTMSADNATAVDNPDLWSVDWVRAHA